MLFIRTTASKEAIGTRHAALLFHVQAVSTSPTRAFTFGNNRAAKIHNTFHIKKFFTDYFSIIIKNLRLRFHFRLYNINWESTKSTPHERDKSSSAAKEQAPATAQGGISACAAPRRRRQKPLPRSANRPGATLVCAPRSRWQQWLPRAVRPPRCP